MNNRVKADQLKATGARVIIVEDVVTTGGSTLKAVDRARSEGLDIARINFSHGSPEDHLRTAEVVRQAAARSGRSIGILADLPGPKLRLGKLHDDPVELVRPIDLAGRLVHGGCVGGARGHRFRCRPRRGDA